ncbi:MAG: 30S ribosome-binding factor RbfA [Elusimicrobia bacterium]|nr:30S ribosome-binding factor RbfA [Elusimicrobiota bacterium]
MFARSERLKELFGQEISRLVSTLKDPGLSGFLTITGVDLSPDMKTARVYYSVLGSLLDRQSTARALERSAGHIRTELTHKLAIKYVPKIVFVFDETPERAHRIESLLNRLHSEEPAAGPFSDESLRTAASTRGRRRPRSGPQRSEGGASGERPARRRR